MNRPTEAEIRGAMFNCSKGEARRMTLPVGFATLDWESREFLGWRDPKAPQRAYLVVEEGVARRGLALRTPDRVSGRPVMCALCRTTHSGGGVALLVAARPGAAGRAGNTVGTYICTDLDCSRHVRMTRATGEIRPEPGVEVEERIRGLRTRAVEFVQRVLGDEDARQVT